MYKTGCRDESVAEKCAFNVSVETKRVTAISIYNRLDGKLNKIYPIIDN